ncbi:PhzF family phenazine biosynthesis protein [Mesorhizobium loti]|nr:PhzF family phenazine biosynthesis protein [Mesorhizobium loti]PLP56839.1 PhzF family phenazine biosynthesis protein [Mesorhizobium loti]
MPSYLHVDVFAPQAYAGNSLPVFLDSADLNADQMLAITRELRHFEAIFLQAGPDARTYRARVFDMFEELPFAGHPIIGAAAALHETVDRGEDQQWTFDLQDKSVTVATRRTGSGYFGLLDQGPAQFLGEVPACDEIAAAFDLTLADLDHNLPLAVVSTGLRYLIVPVRPQVLPRAKIRTDITGLLAARGAQFAVLFDGAAHEIRHWNNDGIIEDIATGSAAGTIGAYCLRYCGARSGKAFTLNQGRFAGRPSELVVEPHGTPDNVLSVKVGGGVAIVGHGSVVTPSPV